MEVKNSPVGSNRAIPGADALLFCLILTILNCVVGVCQPSEKIAVFLGRVFNMVNDITILNTRPAGEYIGHNFISYAEFIDFLSILFSIWINGYRESIHISIFEDVIRVLEHPEKKLSACYWSGNCSQEVITLEPNGNVSPCDKYVGDIDNIYGSLLNTDLADLLTDSSHNQRAISEEIAATEKMRHCKWFPVCHGGCPHDRVINRRHTKGYNDICCGTGKLLTTIKNYLTTVKNYLTTIKNYLITAC